MRAAIANGADAVYLGVEVLNARRGAENFTLATLTETCRFAHLRGTRVYLTANVVVLPDELETALTLVDSAWAAGIDAVIVQDLGLLRSIRSMLPDVRVHASTQMNAHNTPTIEVLASLGVSRVTLAREVSVAEIKLFVSACLAEIEAFVHGALCVCYSGQCLMSSLIGRRSANRGLCAQPCRLPYELISAGHAASATPGAHLLSPKDLAGLAMLPQLLSAGVAAVKVEGRMKSPEYVALVTGVYRSAIDRALANPDAFEPREGEWAVLAESFSRGFSPAYLLGERGNEMMSFQRPNNRGVPLGRVRETHGRRVVVSLDIELEPADTIEFWTSAGRFAQPAGRILHDGAETASAPAGALVEIEAEQPVAVGDRVFRVRNAALSAAAARTYADVGGGKAVPLDFHVRVVLGEPLEVIVSDNAGYEGAARSDAVEAARTKPVAAEEVAEHVGRLGGTPYTVRGWSLELSPGAGIGFSALHRVRREAIERYESAVLSRWAGRRVRNPGLPNLPRVAKHSASPPELVARVADLESARACLAAGATRAIVPVSALGAAADVPSGVTALLPRIAHDREVDGLLRLADPFERVVTGNLGLLVRAAKVGAIVEGDWSLNVLNPQAAAQVAELGASFIWLSPELSGRQIADLARQSPLPVGVAVFGRQEMMVTEHCVLMAEGPCEQKCGACERRLEPHLLRDRKGYEFPVVTDASSRSHVFNAVPLDLRAVLPELVSAGVSAVRLDLELDTAESAARHTKAFRELLQRAGTGVAAVPRDKDSATTSGHYFRGVL
jgi:putative protease